MGLTVGPQLTPLMLYVRDNAAVDDRVISLFLGSKSKLRRLVRDKKKNTVLHHACGNPFIGNDILDKLIKDLAHRH